MTEAAMLAELDKPEAKTLLAHLRRATRASHEELQETLDLLDERLTLAVYISVLKKFYGFWCNWEPYVGVLLQDETLFGPRRRLHLLQSDLQDLGLSATEVRALPLCPPPMLCGMQEALGSLYVMEGSTLGGRIILRNLTRCLSLDGLSGCSYFAGYQDSTGAMWRAFLERLHEQPLADAERVANGALATFECLTSWFSVEH